ncbi:hypothetical protein THASP1DRAFT_25194 [Thamnocephalis sphaerospora]|uniref:Uncharacterized protein n=1 Tax=Thamnocephalis sphaerospora TaxID=78915 RepID=A0A4P9XKZ4_9FUNG|nr:hypothetical protein THASP1DRAFT_25194 [Thamnocephalis sphaerospora]|eukprot:RKP06497.1 hypothetical protein THASP1DRAFT_25194 [Thamnocephalis sphaerospora]
MTNSASKRKSGRKAKRASANASSASSSSSSSSSSSNSDSAPSSPTLANKTLSTTASLPSPPPSGNIATTTTTTITKTMSSSSTSAPRERSLSNAGAEDQSAGTTTTMTTTTTRRSSDAELLVPSEITRRTSVTNLSVSTQELDDEAASNLEVGTRTTTRNTTTTQGEDGRTITTIEEIVEEVIDESQLGEMEDGEVLIEEVIEIVNGVKRVRYIQHNPDGTTEEVDEEGAPIAAADCAADGDDKQVNVSAVEHVEERATVDSAPVPQQDAAVVDVASSAKNDGDAGANLATAAATTTVTEEVTIINQQVDGGVGLLTSANAAYKEEEKEEDEKEEEEEEEEEKEERLLVHSHWDREKVAVLPHEAIEDGNAWPTELPIRRVPSAANEHHELHHEEIKGEPTYATVLLTPPRHSPHHSRPGSPTSKTAAPVTVAHPGTVETKVSAAIVVEEAVNGDGQTGSRSLPIVGAHKLLAKFAARGAAEEVEDYVEETANAYVPKPVLNAAFSAKDSVSDLAGRTGKVLASASQRVSYLQPSEEDAASWHCRSCRVEREVESHWSDWISHPLTTIYARTIPTEEDRPCQRHKSMKQKVGGWLPTWASIKTRTRTLPTIGQATKSVTDPIWTTAGSIRNVASSFLPTTLVGTPATNGAEIKTAPQPQTVVADAFAGAEHDRYGQPLSTYERSRRTRLTQRAQGRVAGIRGDLPHRVSDAKAVQHGNGVVAGMFGTAIGLSYGLGMAAFDAITH